MDLLALKEKLMACAPGRWVLLAASKLYGWAGWLDRLAYQNGWKTVKSVNGRVV